MAKQKYKLRLKAFDNVLYTDKMLRLEHKGIIALARKMRKLKTGFTAADLAEFTWENTKTISVYLRELEEARYIDRVSYSDEDRI